LFEWILDTYKEKKINVFARDYEGNTGLHHAVMNNNIGMIQKLYNIDPEKCMFKNHQGKSPFHLAVEEENFAVLTDVFADYKLPALLQRDALGENILFSCARNGNEKIFRWFMGSNEYYKARGMQNYKGRTVEHIVCMTKQIDIVDEINPRPDTPDYYGSLPFFYTLQQDDLPMIQK